MSHHINLPVPFAVIWQKSIFPVDKSPSAGKSFTDLAWPSAGITAKMKRAITQIENTSLFILSPVLQQIVSIKIFLRFIQDEKL